MNKPNLMMLLGAALCTAPLFIFASYAIPGHLKKSQGIQSKPQIPHQLGTAKSVVTQIGVQMNYEFLNTVPDASGLLTLKMTRAEGGKPATLELKPDPAISLAMGLPTPQVQFNAGDVYTVKIKPAAQGLHYLNVFIYSDQSSDALAIPVQIGARGHQPQAAQAATVPEGKKVVSLRVPYQ
jgi:hypothetical protein